MSSKPTIKTPFAKLLPPLSDDEFAALKASIKVHGVLDPILEDEDGNILDGRHRLKIDPNAPRKVVKGLGSDAEKKAFVFQTNNARRNLSPGQKKKLIATQREVALALRDQDPKKFTEKVVAGMMGVDQSTISRRLSRSGNNMHVHNASTPRQDARSKVPETVRSTVPDRVKKGESKKEIAKELGVTQRTVSNIVKSKSQKASGKKSAAVPNAVSGEAQQLPNTQSSAEESSAVPAAALPGHEEEPSPTTPFDEAIAEVQAMLENLKPCNELTRKIATLVPGAIDVENNVNSATNLTQRFAKALKKLEAKAAEFREQPTDDEAIPAKDEDETDTGRPSLRIAGKVA